ncbi:MAG: response regulator [Hyphomicrobiaceae bacterium]|nr:MAG: response regulator [Hyphomicrobiaceae bacterium]
MSLAESIAPFLPHLRRFARLLTGSQKTGDAAVARVLEAIVTDPSAFPDLPPRAALYKCFLTTVAVDYDEPDAGVEALGATATRSLAALEPRAREAFLLATVEDFTRFEVARILDVSESDVGALLEEVGTVIGRQISTDVLIIEDEPLIAVELERLMTDLGHRVMSIARTYDDALRAAALHEPGLILADLRLADGSSGLDAVNDLLGRFSVPVVFITAYPEKLMTGERPEPTFLIAKPFRDDAVRAIVSQVLFFDQQARRRRSGRATPR